MKDCSIKWPDKSVKKYIFLRKYSRPLMSCDKDCFEENIPGRCRWNHLAHSLEHVYSGYGVAMCHS